MKLQQKTAAEKLNTSPATFGWQQDRTYIEAAASGMYHPKWDERPGLFVVRKSGAECNAEDVTAFLTDKVAKWWLPDAVEFLEEIPRTSTGKFQKTALRERFKDYALK